MPNIIKKMNKVEASQCADLIRSCADRMVSLLIEFHDRDGWSALGYESFSECVASEFSMSRTHAHRLIRFGEIKAIIDQSAQPTGCAKIPQTLSEAAVRETKSLPPAKAAKVIRKAAAKNNGVATASSVKEMMDQRPAFGSNKRHISGDLDDAFDKMDTKPKDDDIDESEPEEIIDGRGEPVYEAGLRDIYSRLPEMTELLTLIQRVRAKVKSLSEEKLGAHIEISAVDAYLKNAWGAIKQSMHYTTCVWCKSGCKKCRNTRSITKAQYEVSLSK